MRPGLLAAAGALLLGGGFAAGWRARAPRPGALQEARRHAEVGAALDEVAEDHREALEASRRQVARLVAQVAALKAKSQAEGTPLVQLPQARLVEIIQAQGPLLAAQDERARLLEARAETLERARNEWRASAKAMPPAEVLPWSAGVIYAPPQGGRPAMIGAMVRRDLGPAFVQIEAFRDRAAVAAGWRW